MKTRDQSKAKSPCASAKRAESRRAGSNGKLLAAACLAVGLSASRWAEAAYTWTPGGVTGGSGTWDTTSANWSSAGSLQVWPNTTYSNAYFSGTGGNVTVVSTGVTTGNIGTFTTTGYNISGGTITENGGGFTIVENSGVNTTVTAPIAGSNGAIFDGNSYNTSTLTLGGNNSYTGTTLVETMACFFPVLAPTNSNSSFGQSGNVDIGSSASTVDLYYTGTGAGTTDRLWQWVGSSYGYILNNSTSSTGALSFTNTGSAIGGIIGAKILQFGGANTNTSLNTFAENISDSGSGANLSSVIISNEAWEFTNTNTYSGGTTLSSSSATSTLELNNPSATGTGSVTIQSGGSLTFLAGMTYPNEINLTAVSTYQPHVVNATPSGAGSGVNITGLITGSGNLRLATTSNSTAGSIEVSDDLNNFTGTLATGIGFVAFTSVANAGSPSSLGEGSAIYIQNTSSAATFQYLGANNDTTTKPIIWGGTSGQLNLDSSGGGSVQYLNTGVLRSGAGSTVSDTETLNLTGTSTGANVLAESITDVTPVIVNSSTTYVGGVTSVAKNLAGNWILTGSNTYSGSTTIAGGTLEVDSADNGSSGPLGNGGTISFTGGTLQYSAVDTADYSGRIAIGYSTKAISIDTNGQNVTFATGINGQTVVGSTTTGAIGGLTKYGSGMLAITGANAYTGTTTVSGGNLTVDASDPGGTLPSVTPNANASIAGSATITIGAAGTLHLLNSAATAPVSMLSTAANVSVVTGSTVILDLGGQTQTINTFSVGGTQQDPGTYGSAAYFAGLAGGTPTLTTEQTNDEVFFGTSDGAFVVTNAPEPSALAALGIGSLGLLRRRRRAARNI